MSAIDRHRAQRREVRGNELAIEQGEMTDAKSGNQPGQRNL
jgi:hypothetical protein